MNKKTLIEKNDDDGSLEIGSGSDGQVDSIIDEHEDMDHENTMKKEKNLLFKSNPIERKESSEGYGATNMQVREDLSVKQSQDKIVGQHSIGLPSSGLQHNGLSRGVQQSITVHASVQQSQGSQHPTGVISSAHTTGVLSPGQLPTALMSSQQHSSLFTGQQSSGYLSPGQEQSGVYSYFVDEVGGRGPGKRVPYHIFNKMLATPNDSSGYYKPGVSHMLSHNVPRFQPSQLSPHLGQNKPGRICQQACTGRASLSGSSYNAGGCFENPFLDSLVGKVKKC